MSRFVLISSHAGFEQRLRQAVTGGLHGSVQTLPAAAVFGGPQEVLVQLHGEAPEVVLLGPGIAGEDALKFATVFDLQYPEISLVLVAGSDPQLLVGAMRSGVRDILSPDAEAEEIRIILERACLCTAGRRRGLASPAVDGREAGRVIAVMSPKGGVGKTTVAANLAVGLGKVAPMSVVLVDLDAQFGDVASGLSLDPEHTLIDAVTGAAAQDSMVLKAFLTVHPAGIYALCGPRSPAEAEAVTAEHVRRLLEQLASEFRYVIIDTSPGLGEHVLMALEHATDALWVVGMDIPSIRGLRKELDILQELELLPQGRHVALNFADRHAGLSVADVEATLGVPVDVVIPRSRTLPYSTNKGVPLLQDNTKDAATRSLRRLVGRFDAEYSAKVAGKVHRREVIS